MIITLANEDRFFKILSIVDYRSYHPILAIGAIEIFLLVNETRIALGGAHVPPTKVFRRLTASVNETIVKPRVAAAVGRKTILKPCLAAATNTYTSDFPDVKFRITWLIR